MKTYMHTATRVCPLTHISPLVALHTDTQLIISCPALLHLTSTPNYTTVSLYRHDNSNYDTNVDNNDDENDDFDADDNDYDDDDYDMTALPMNLTLESILLLAYYVTKMPHYLNPW